MPFASSIERNRVRKFLEDPETFATVLGAILVDNFGFQALNWDPVSIERELEEEFHAQLPRINKDKIQAFGLVVTTDAFYRDWLAFNTVCEAFNSDPVDPETLDPATPDQIAWTLAEVALLEDPQDRPQFDEEVRRYIGGLLTYFGLDAAPDDISVAIMPDPDPTSIGDIDVEFTMGNMSQDRADANDVREYVIDRTQALIQQLSDVPLANRDNETWNAIAQKLAQKLQKLPA